MAIKCSECGHDVNTNAEKCPNCGAPIKQTLVKGPTLPQPKDALKIMEFDKNKEVLEIPEIPEIQELQETQPVPGEASFFRQLNIFEILALIDGVFLLLLSTLGVLAFVFLKEPVAYTEFI